MWGKFFFSSLLSPPLSLLRCMSQGADVWFCGPALGLVSGTEMLKGRMSNGRARERGFPEIGRKSWWGG